MYSRKEIDKELKSFDEFIENSDKSPELKLQRVIESCIFFNIQKSLHYLYEKLTSDPIYRGSGTFSNFAASLSDENKFYIIKLIEELCKNDKLFNDEVKLENDSEIIWSENFEHNKIIQRKLGIKIGKTKAKIPRDNLNEYFD